MPEKLTEQKVYRVDYFCDCGGDVEFDGMALTSHPAKYPHKCKKCGKQHVLFSIYPTVRYEDAEMTK